MRLVDARRRAAVEREPERVADGLLPVRVELLHQPDRVPHQAQAGRERRLEVILAFGRLADRDSEQRVEAAGRGHVGGDDPDRVEREESRVDCIS